MTTWLCWFLFTQIVEIPIVWFVFPRLIHAWLPMAICAELFAVAVEAMWLRAFGVKRPLLWSLVANTASFGLGMLGWPW